jgi:hypothetical protein
MVYAIFGFTKRQGTKVREIVAFQEFKNWNQIFTGIKIKVINPYICRNLKT